jgi:hypothetical protein
VSSPKIKNISLYQKDKSGLRIRPSHPTRGADHDRHDRAVGCGGRDGADNERRWSVRQRRVVPTSRCWRQRTWRQPLPGRNGGKRAVLRGELVISRKAIAQGMSDVLRCPVCSWAHFLVHIAHETAGAARIRHSLRPLDKRAGNSSTPRAQCVARRRSYVQPSLPATNAKRLCKGAKRRSNPHLLCRQMDCFAEPVIGRAFARPVGSQ